MMAGTAQSVLHLVGSPVDEFHADLSRLYARACLPRCADAGRGTTSTWRTCRPDGTWRFPADLSAGALSAAAPMSLRRRASPTSTSSASTSMVPQMFCLPGMTSYRALFDVARHSLPGQHARR